MNQLAPILSLLDVANSMGNTQEPLTNRQALKLPQAGESRYKKELSRLRQENLELAAALRLQSLQLRLLKKALIEDVQKEFENPHVADFLQASKRHFEARV